MTAIMLRKRLSGVLEPIDEAGRDAIMRIKAGDVVRAEVSRPRNLQHHKKWWALVSLIYQNQSRYKSPEALNDAIKVYVGHCEVVALQNGKVMHVPKSIAFHAMDQFEFEEFYDRAIDMICQEIIPRLNKEDLKRELLEFTT